MRKTDRDDDDEDRHAGPWTSPESAFELHLRALGTRRPAS